MQPEHIRAKYPPYARGGVSLRGRLFYNAFIAFVFEGFKLVFKPLAAAVNFFQISRRGVEKAEPCRVLEFLGRYRVFEVCVNEIGYVAPDRAVGQIFSYRARRRKIFLDCRVVIARALSKDGCKLNICVCSQNSFCVFQP